MRKSIAYCVGLTSLLALFAVSCGEDTDKSKKVEETKTTSAAMVIGKFTVDESGQILDSLKTVSFDQLPSEMNTPDTLDENKIAELFTQGKTEEVVIGNPDEDTSTSQCHGRYCGNGGYWFPGKYLLRGTGAVLRGIGNLVENIGRGLMGRGRSYYGAYSVPYVHRASCGYGVSCSGSYSYSNYYSASSWGRSNSYYSNSYGSNAYDMYGVYAPCSSGYSSYSVYSSTYSDMCGTTSSYYSSYWNRY